MATLRRAGVLGVACAATITLAAACGDNSGSGNSSSGAIKIGVPVPTSGDYASAGQDIFHGAQLAAEAINSGGGINGRKIELLEADDACSAQVGAQAAQKLISQGIVAAAGGYCSSASLPELSAFHRVGIPYVMDASTNPQLTEQGFKEAFRTIGRDDQQGPFAAKFIAGQLKAKRAAVVNDNTTYSKGLAENTVQSLQKEGVQVVYDNALSPGQSDYTPVLTKIKSSNPDVVYYTGYYAEAALLVKQADQLGLKAQFMGGDATNDPTLLKTAGSAANGMIVTTAPLPQFLGSSGADFVTKYRQKFNTEPGPYSVYEYDAVQVLAKAMAKASSTKPKDVAAALAGVEHDGVTGKIAFDEKGDRANPVYITIVVRAQKFAPDKKLDDQGAWVDATTG